LLSKEVEKNTNNNVANVIQIKKLQEVLKLGDIPAIAVFESSLAGLKISKGSETLDKWDLSVYQKCCQVPFKQRQVFNQLIF